MDETRSHGHTEIPAFQPGDPSKFVFPAHWEGTLRPAQPCGIGTVCEVEVPGRVHASVLDMNRFGVGRPGGGGIGFAVGIYSKVRISLTPDLGITSRGTRAAVGSHLAEMFQSMMGVDLGMSIEVDDHGYQHIGLGSSIGVVTAVMVALNELFGRPLGLRDLRMCIAHNYCEEASQGPGMLVRGFETNVGAMVGIHGGMVVASDDCALVSRIALPPQMKALIVFPEMDNKAVSGDNEADNLINFARNFDIADAGAKAFRVLMDLLPAMKRADINAIGDVIYDLSRLGSKRAECRLHGNQGDEIYRSIENFRRLGAEIVCMSSVGPAIFAMSTDEKVFSTWIDNNGSDMACKHLLLPVDNTGVRVRLDRIPVNYKHEAWWE